MALPTDGYAPTSVTYTLGTSRGLTVRIEAGVDTEERRTAFEEIQPFLETALNNLRAEYQANTDPVQSVLYIDRTCGGGVRDSVVQE